MDFGGGINKSENTHLSGVMESKKKFFWRWNGEKRK